MKGKRDIVICLLALTGCTAPVLISSQQESVQNSSNPDIESLNRGRSLYVNKCGGCHYLYKPENFPEEKWRKEIPEMADRAHISMEEQEAILKYLLATMEAELAKNGN